MGETVKRTLIVGVLVLAACVPSEEATPVDPPAWVNVGGAIFVGLLLGALWVMVGALVLTGIGSDWDGPEEQDIDMIAACIVWPVHVLKWLAIEIVPKVPRFLRDLGVAIGRQFARKP